MTHLRHLGTLCWSSSVTSHFSGLVKPPPQGPELRQLKEWGLGKLVEK